MLSSKLLFSFLITIFSNLICINCLSQQITPILPLGHTRPINAIDVHPDNNTILSASDDGSIKLWDVPSGLQSLNLKAHEGKVYDASFSEDGSFIVSCGQDMKIRLWKTGEKEAIREFSGHNAAITSVSISKNNNWILSTSYDHTIKLWDLREGDCLHTFLGHKNAVNSAYFSLDEKYIISGGGLFIGEKDNSIRIWDIASGQYTTKLIGHKDAINDLAVSDDGMYIASGSDDQTVRIWNVETGKEKAVLNTQASINSLRFSSDGQYLLLGLANNIIELWNIEQASLEVQYLGHTDFVNSITFSKNYKYFFSASDDVSIKMWSTETGNVLRTFKGQFKPFYASTFSADGKYLATSSLLGQIKLWDMRTGQQIKTFRNNTNILGANRLSFSPDNELLISSQFNINGNNTIILWDVSNGLQVEELEGHLSIINDVDISMDGNFLVSCSSDSVKIWDMRNSIKANTISVPYNNIMTVEFVDDLSNILIGTEDHKLSKWDRNGHILKQYTGHLSRVMDAKISPNGKYILSGGGEINSSELILWDIENGEKIRTFNTSSQKGFTSSLEFSPNGGYAVSGSFDGTICIWDIGNIEPISTFAGHSGFITNVNFSPEGNFFISSSGDNTIKIWDFENKELLFTLFTLDNKEWAVISTNGYYFCSKEMAKKMGFRFKDNFYPFEQFDLQFNRPDLIAASMPFYDTLLVKALQRTYLKRHRKTKLNVASAFQELGTPILKLLSQTPPFSTNDSLIKIRIQAKDSLSTIESLHVFINDVPIYGRNGTKINGNSNSAIEKNITIKLSNGANKIQITARNKIGISSLPITIQINKTGSSKKPNLHLIGFGASQYQESSMNLKYPDKDVRDIVKFFIRHSDLFDKIKVDTFLNKNYTLTNIQNVKKGLLKTNENDCVIVFAAGHGLITRQFDYFLAAFDTDFSNPNIHGIPYSLLEDLLDSIPARQKLLLIDACHSGEIDKEEIELVKNNLPNKGSLKFRSFNDSIPKSNHLGLYNSFELMQQIFVDIRRGTGATVISSASGLEFAWEGEKWNNSVFTYSLLTGLSEKRADLNSDGNVMISELQSFLANEVSKLTNDHQQPTFRLQNNTNDWRIW